jgi:glycosyltransferase involved in cell wall biosynthesis
VRREERHAWSHLDGCTVTSVRDQEMLLSDEPTAHTAVVPNGVDLEFFRPSPGSVSHEPQTLLFFGAIDYYPNTDAMLFFLHDALPQLAARYPQLRLCIVGRKPPESILAQRSATVEVTGVVDDVRPWIDRADVVIVPLRIGGGTRLKILEAMAMGKAVVSTTLGAEGLDVVPERDLLIADDADGVVAQVGRLLDDPELGRRIGASARQFVASRYSWKDGGRQPVNVLRRASGGARGGRMTLSAQGGDLAGHGRPHTCRCSTACAARPFSWCCAFISSAMRRHTRRWSERW